MEKKLSWIVALILCIEFGSGFSIGYRSHDLQKMLIGREVSGGQSRSVEEDVEFLLWTKSNPTSEIKLKPGDIDGLLTSPFNPDHQTKVLIHGYMDIGNAPWILTIRDNYLDQGDFNIISVDWQKLASNPLYFIAAHNTKPVGYFAASFISFLAESGGLKLEDAHVIGHSLGSHLGGYLGSKLNGELGRITGLDPAGPLFDWQAPEERLDTTDAKFVDIIHTAGSWIGYFKPLGHVDFYPNSGLHPQPSCSHDDSGLTCSHSRAYELFAESITSNVGFLSHKCDSWETFLSGECDKSTVPTNMMGEPADASLPGVFYLSTNEQPPFAISPDRRRN